MHEAFPNGNKLIEYRIGLRREIHAEERITPITINEAQEVLAERERARDDDSATQLLLATLCDEPLA